VPPVPMMSQARHKSNDSLWTLLRWVAMASPGERFRLRARSRSVQPQGAIGGEAPFTSFMVRHEERERRARGKRRMFAVSVAVHVAVFAVVWLFSAWKVDELFGRRVEVNVSSPQPELGPDGKPKHLFPTNIGRALGVHVVVTPSGTTTEARVDPLVVSADLAKQLQQLILKPLLSSLAYPIDAKALRLRGAVSVLVDVDEKGKATQLDVKIPCSNLLLCVVAKSAVAQIDQWPVSSKAAERSFLVPIEFRPD
jgi:hypothetical protein